MTLTPGSRHMTSPEADRLANRSVCVPLFSVQSYAWRLVMGVEVVLSGVIAARGCGAVSSKLTRNSLRALFIPFVQYVWKAACTYS